MSRVELIEIADRTSPEDRLFLGAYLSYLAGQPISKTDANSTAGWSRCARGTK